MAKNTTLPLAMPISDALAQSEPLSRIRALIQTSNRNLQTVRSLLPPAMLGHVRPGPVDEEGWSLLVDNPAVAAKLRQLLPSLEAALLQRDGKRSAIRIKVQSGRPD